MVRLPGRPVRAEREPLGGAPALALPARAGTGARLPKRARALCGPAASSALRRRALSVDRGGSRGVAARAPHAEGVPLRQPGVPAAAAALCCDSFLTCPGAWPAAPPGGCCREPACWTLWPPRAGLAEVTGCEERLATWEAQGWPWCPGAHRPCAEPADAAADAAWAGVVAPFVGPVPDAAAAAAAVAEVAGLHAQAAGGRGARCLAAVGPTSPGVRGLSETAPEGAGLARPGERGVSPGTLPTAAAAPPVLGALPATVACGAERRALFGVDQRSPKLGGRAVAAATTAAVAVAAAAAGGDAESDSTEREEPSRGNGCTAPGDSGFIATGGLGPGAAPLVGGWGTAVDISCTSPAAALVGRCAGIGVVCVCEVDEVGTSCASPPAAGLVGRRAGIGVSCVSGVVGRPAGTGVSCVCEADEVDVIIRSCVCEADEADVIMRSMLSIILRFFSASK